MNKKGFEVIQTLKGEVYFLLNRINELEKKMEDFEKIKEKEASTISIAYTISGIYSCFEDIFEKIARCFENRIENPASWHKEMLERMQIEVPGIRPSVLSQRSFLILNRMRAFRHLFRSSYMFELDEERLGLLVKEWRETRDLMKNDILEFLKKIK
ncbi:MAG: hypothetical protein AB1297_09550 [bacterium]